MTELPLEHRHIRHHSSRPHCEKDKRVWDDWALENRYELSHSNHHYWSSVDCPSCLLTFPTEVRDKPLSELRTKDSHEDWFSANRRKANLIVSGLFILILILSTLALMQEDPVEARVSSVCQPSDKHRAWLLECIEKSSRGDNPIVSCQYAADAMFEGEAPICKQMPQFFTNGLGFLSCDESHPSSPEESACRELGWKRK